MLRGGRRDKRERPPLCVQGGMEWTRLNAILITECVMAKWMPRAVRLAASIYDNGLLGLLGGGRCRGRRGRDRGRISLT